MKETLIIFPILVLGLFMITNFAMLGTTTTTYTVNGTEQTATYTLDPSVGFIAFIGIILVVGGVAGIRVLGSGLSSPSVILIIKSSLWLGIWGVMSAFGYQQIFSIPYIGMFIYLALTVCYVVGFVLTLGFGGGD